MFMFGGELYDDGEEAEEEDWDISRMLARYVSGISESLSLTDSSMDAG